MPEPAPIVAYVVAVAVWASVEDVFGPVLDRLVAYAADSGSVVLLRRRVPGEYEA